jgi:hypothetical protein
MSFTLTSVRGFGRLTEESSGVHSPQAEDQHAAGFVVPIPRVAAVVRKGLIESELAEVLHVATTRRCLKHPQVQASINRRIGRVPLGAAELRPL